MVDAERMVTIAEFSAQASVKKAEGEAKSKTIQASADAQVLKTVGDATAVKTLAIGNAEAAVTKAKIESMEAGNYAAIQVAQALAQSGFRLVPDIMVAGGANGQGGGTLVDVLPHCDIPDRPLYALHAPGSQTLTRVQLFLDFVSEWFRSRPRPAAIQPGADHIGLNLQLKASARADSLS